MKNSALAREREIGMSNLSLSRVYQEDKIRRIKLMFADTLFGQLRQTVFGDKAVDVLADHLGIAAEDVRKWLKAEALPNQAMLRRIMVIFKGTNIVGNHANDHSECMGHVIDLVEEAERSKILREIEITHPKSE